MSLMRAKSKRRRDTKSARNFDGTNDNLLSADNALPGLDVNVKTWAMWITRASDPAGNQVMLVTGTANAGTGICIGSMRAPTTAGWRLGFIANWTTDGDWVSTADISNTRHHIAVTYDRGSAANDPVMYVDGVSVGVTELVAPLTTALTGDDTLKMGESLGGTADLAATEQHVAIEAGVAWTAAQVNRAMWWGRPHGGLLTYYPLVTGKLTDEGSGGATLTATGTTVVAMVTPVVRPGSMVGMGW